jgi:hypothetical protein
MLVVSFSYFSLLAICFSMFFLQFGMIIPNRTNAVCIPVASRRSEGMMRGRAPFGTWDDDNAKSSQLYIYIHDIIALYSVFYIVLYSVLYIVLNYILYYILYSI